MNNKEKIYEMMCKKCKTLVPSIISQAHRRKGCRTICLQCNTESKGWKNYQSLKLFDVEQELKTAETELEKENALKNKKEVKQDGK